MNEDEIFEKTQGAYLCLIHPIERDGTFKKDIVSVISLAPSVTDEIVAAMITGVSWRERLLGLCMAMSKKSGAFAEAMVKSLQDPRGIAIVPTCAALAVLARAGVFTIPRSFADMFNRAAFDGEVGWAVDKAMHFAGLRSDDVPGRGPNSGQIFDDHAELYGSLIAS